jgi:hypothetical protein
MLELHDLRTCFSAHEMVTENKADRCLLKEKYEGAGVGMSGCSKVRWPTKGRDHARCRTGSPALDYSCQEAPVLGSHL